MANNVTINNKIDICKTYDVHDEGQDTDHDNKQDQADCFTIFLFLLDGDQYRGPSTNDRDHLVGQLTNKVHDYKQQNRDTGWFFLTGPP